MANTGIILADIGQPVFDADELRKKRLGIENAQQQHQINQQGIEQNKLELEQRKRDQQDQEIIRKSYMDAKGDITGTQQLAMQRGASPKAMTALQTQAMALSEQHAKLDDQQLKNETAKAQAIGSTAQTLLAIPDEAQRAIQWPAARAQMMQQGHATAAEIPEQYPGEQFLTLHRNASVTVQQSLENTFKDRERKTAEQNASLAQQKATLDAAKDAREAPGQIADAAQKERTNDAAALAAAARQSPEAFAAALGELPHKRAIAFAGAKNPEEILQRGMTPTEQTSAATRKEEVNKLNTKAELAARAADPRLPQDDRAAAEAGLKRLVQAENAVKQTAQNAGVSLTPDAISVMADMFLKTGQLANTGYGAAGAKTKVDVLNAAAAKAPGADVASAKADYKADSASLSKLQQNRDAVKAFENTALKNLDQFLTTAKSVVDFGGPYINRPLREISERLVGSDKVTAFNVARQVAVTEIAKVLSNPGLTGQLSDSARHEVQGLIGADATLKQIYAAAQILKTDMKNRAESLDSQLGEIRGRIGKGSPAPPAAPAAKTNPFRK